MKMSEEEIRTVLQMVQKEPRTVQEIAQTIDRSWVTTEKYLQELRDKTGQISMKTFREGTQAALKLVYFNSNDLTLQDDVKQSLAQKILAGKTKNDFDFMDVYQFIHEGKKTAYAREVAEEQHMTTGELVKKKAKKTVFILSGNMSFLTGSYREKEPVVDFMEEELRNGVSMKVLCRVNISSLSNIERLSQLLIKYPSQLEIRHRYHPLRGLIIDDDFMRFKSWENKDEFRMGELHKSVRVYYETTDESWIRWMQQVFWSMWRSSIDYQTRIKEIQKIIGNNAGEYYASKAKAD